MLVEYYVDALIADERAADQIWTLWDSGAISDDQAALELSFEALTSTTVDCGEQILTARFQAAADVFKTQLLSELAERILQSRPEDAEQILRHMGEQCR